MLQLLSPFTRQFLFPAVQAHDMYQSPAKGQAVIHFGDEHVIYVVHFSLKFAGFHAGIT